MASLESNGSACASGVTVHACGAADPGSSSVSAAPIAAATAPLPIKETDKNRANALSGESQSCVLPGSNVPLPPNPRLPAWLIPSMNNAAGMGELTNGRGGRLTPSKSSTPTAGEKMEDDRDIKTTGEKKRPAASIATDIGHYTESSEGNCRWVMIDPSTVLSGGTDDTSDVFQRRPRRSGPGSALSKSPRRDHNDTSSVIAGAAEKLEDVTKKWNASKALMNTTSPPPGNEGSTSRGSACQSSYRLGSAIVPHFDMAGDENSQLARIQKNIMNNYGPTMEIDWLSKFNEAQKYITHIEGQCWSTVSQACVALAESREQQVVLIGQAKDLCQEHSDLLTRAVDYEATMTLQQAHMKAHLDQEQTFKQQAMKEYNALHATASADVTTLQNNLAATQTQLRFVAQTESNLRGMLLASEGQAADLQQAGNEQYKMFHHIANRMHAENARLLTVTATVEDQLKSECGQVLHLAHVNQGNLARIGKMSTGYQDILSEHSQLAATATAERPLTAKAGNEMVVARSQATAAEKERERVSALATQAGHDAMASISEKRDELEQLKIQLRDALAKATSDGDVLRESERVAKELIVRNDKESLARIEELKVIASEQEEELKDEVERRLVLSSRAATLARELEVARSPMTAAEVVVPRSLVAALDPNLIGNNPEEVALVASMLAALDERRAQIAADQAAEVAQEKLAAAQAAGQIPEGYEAIPIWNDAEWKNWTDVGYYVRWDMPVPGGLPNSSAQAGAPPTGDSNDSGGGVGGLPGFQATAPGAAGAGGNSTPNTVPENSADAKSHVDQGEGTPGVEKLPVGHRVYTSQHVPRGSKILQVDDTRGIIAGMRFLLGKDSTTEIIKVHSLGSIVLCEGTVHSHDMDTPLVLLVDHTVDSAPAYSAGEAQDRELGLSPIPPGLDVQKGNRERKFKLPTMGLPKSRKLRQQWHMYLVEIVIVSNSGLNEVREREFLNFANLIPNMEDYKNPVLWIVPGDMIVLNAIIVTLLTEAIEKGLGNVADGSAYDQTLFREMRNMRTARFAKYGFGLSARILLAMLYHSLQRASGHIANLSNKNHFLKIDYMEFKDDKMEEFLDECMNRIALCDGLTNDDIEGTIQKQLIHSKKLRPAVELYLKRPQADQTCENLFQILHDECEIREVFRRNAYEEKLIKTGFDGKTTADQDYVQQKKKDGKVPRPDGVTKDGGQKNDRRDTRTSGRHARKDLKYFPNKAGGHVACYWDFDTNNWAAAAEEDLPPKKTRGERKKNAKGTAPETVAPAGFGAAVKGGGKARTSDAGSSYGGSSKGSAKGGGKRKGEKQVCWAAQTALNGGYECPRTAEECNDCHKPCTMEVLLKRRPPRWIVEAYRKGQGKGQHAWQAHFKKNDAELFKKGKGKGKGTPAGSRSASGASTPTKKPWVPKDKEKKTWQPKTAAVAGVLSQKEISETMAFVATGYPICNRKECNDTKCHKTKNHRGYKPLKKNPHIAAVAMPSAPSTYGQSRAVDHAVAKDADGWQAVGGIFVSGLKPDCPVVPDCFIEEVYDSDPNDD